MGGGYLVALLNLLNMGGGPAAVVTPTVVPTLTLPGRDRSVLTLTGSLEFLTLPGRDRSVLTLPADTVTP